MEVVRKIALGHDSLVGPAGLEPATSSTPRKRATTCATARRDHYNGNGGTRECGNVKTATTGHAIRDGRSSRDPLTLCPSPSRGRGMRLAPLGASPTREMPKCGNAVGQSGGRAVAVGRDAQQRDRGPRDSLLDDFCRDRAPDPGGRWLPAGAKGFLW